jgi:zinc/manganese transport system substrate-binding protein
MKRRLLASLLAVGTVAALAACAPTTAPADDGELRIVASTNVYGDLAATIAGPDAVVTSIIDDPSADPHGFEANPRVQLELARADLVIANGGGYDDFVDEMLEASGNTTAVVIHAYDLGRQHVIDAGNEHVWYDYTTMGDLVHTIDVELNGIVGRDSDRSARAAALSDDIRNLFARLGDLIPEAAEKGYILTEPVPFYLLRTPGMTDLTPPEFSEAIENDTDVPPALLQDVLNLIPEAAVVVVNEQTGGPQTDAVIDMAGENDVPWFGVSETLPDGMDYVTWQSGIIDLLEAALER